MKNEYGRRGDRSKSLYNHGDFRHKEVAVHDRYGHPRERDGIAGHLMWFGSSGRGGGRDRGATLLPLGRADSLTSSYQ